MHVVYKVGKTALPVMHNHQKHIVGRFVFAKTEYVIISSYAKDFQHTYSSKPQISI